MNELETTNLLFSAFGGGIFFTALFVITLIWKQKYLPKQEFIDWVKDYTEPEDFFDYETLTGWAELNDYEYSPEPEPSLEEMHGYGGPFAWSKLNQ